MFMSQQLRNGGPCKVTAAQAAGTCMAGSQQHPGPYPPSCVCRSPAPWLLACTLGALGWLELPQQRDKALCGRPRRTERLQPFRGCTRRSQLKRRKNNCFLKHHPASRLPKSQKTPPVRQVWSPKWSSCAVFPRVHLLELLHGRELYKQLLFSPPHQETLVGVPVPRILKHIMGVVKVHVVYCGA